MGKFNLNKGDKIEARSPSAYDGGTRVGGHIPYDKPLTVTKVFNHGVRTKELGYIHNNNILNKQ